MVEEYFEAASDEPDWNPRFNIAPTQPVPVIRQNPKEPGRELSLMRWGLIPLWSKDMSGAAMMINARSETAATKPAFPLRRLEDQKTLNQRTIKAKLMGELSEDDFKTMKASIDTETKRIQEQIKALAERSTMEELVTQTECEVINFGKSWREASAARKRGASNSPLLEGFGIRLRIALLLSTLPLVNSMLKDVLASLVLLASPTGFEPVLPP